MATYLVTGSAGFIAARVIQLLLANGDRVVGVDNMNNAYDVRMKQYRLAKLLDHPGFTFIKADISEQTFLDRPELYQENFSAVINLAARAGVRQSLENPWVYVETNVTGTLNLLELCQKERIPKFILASTSSIYGDDAPLPTPESANSDHPLQVYAASKKGAEALCHAYHHLHGIDITIFRYFTVYGPAPRPDMVMFRFTQWISEERPVLLNGDGEQTRGFTYVDDIAQGTILGLKPMGYEVINLGGHQVIKINDLISHLEKLIGKQANVQRRPRHPADMLANWADVHKADHLLGWKPQVTLEQGINNLVTWYQAERTWASQIDTS